MERDIASLKDHYIICGAGRVGHSVARELAHKPCPFVIVESDEESVAELDPKWLVLVGDAASEKTLREAGIERATGLVAATTTDATNIYIVLTARGLNPRLKIIARASEEARGEAPENRRGRCRDLSLRCRGPSHCPEFSAPAPAGFPRYHQ